MSSTTQVTTFSDLYTDFLNRVREGTGVTALETLAKRYINTALQDVHINPGTVFPWSIRSAVLLTHAPYSTGTVDISASARTTVTGTDTLWNTAVTGMGFNNAQAGGKMKFAGDDEVYTVSSVGSDTAITLSTRYTGDALDDDTYTYFEDEYALASDYGRMVDLRIFSVPRRIPLIGPIDFRTRYGRNDTTGKPCAATLIQLGFSGSSTPRHRVVLGPAPDGVYSIPYEYVTANLAVSSAGSEQAALSADADEPIMPLRYRHVLVFHALFHYYRDYKDDARSQEVKVEYIDTMTRMSNDFGIGQKDRPRIIPMRPGGRPIQQRFDVSGRFDRLEDL